MEKISQNHNDILQILKKAGIIALEEQTVIQYWKKPDNSIVSNGDLKVNQFLTTKLSHLFPEYQIISEEADLTHESSEYKIILDPIDGTDSYLKKQDTWAILIGFINHNKIIAGYVYQPSQNNLYYTYENKAYYHDGVKETELKECFQPKNNAVITYNDYEAEEYLKKLNIKEIKYMYSAALKIIEVAKNNADIYVNCRRKCSVWDLVAPIAILEKSGGHFESDNPLILNSENTSFPYNFSCYKK